MQGVVFCELVDWIESRHGVELVDEVLLDAELSHGGAYTTAGTYDWRELHAIAAALARHLGSTADDVLRDYGCDLFAVFASRFAALVGGAAGPFELLSAIGTHIEHEVGKLYVDTELPRFRAARTAGGFVLDYESSRPFASLAHGLVEGCCRHFGVAADVVMRGTGERRRFDVTVTAEAACRATR